jgi:hypothetical protein
MADTGGVRGLLVWNALPDRRVDVVDFCGRVSAGQVHDNEAIARVVERR